MEVPERAETGGIRLDLGNSRIQNEEIRRVLNDCDPLFLYIDPNRGKNNSSVKYRFAYFQDPSAATNLCARKTIAVCLISYCFGIFSCFYQD